jgi:hypothetical protein
MTLKVKKGSPVYVAPACAGSEERSDHFGSYVRSISLRFCKRLFPGLEPMTSWSQGNSFTAAQGLASTSYSKELVSDKLLTSTIKKFQYLSPTVTQTSVYILRFVCALQFMIRNILLASLIEAHNHYSVLKPGDN